MAQQPVMQTLLRNRPQLLLDALQRTAERHAARQRRRYIHDTGIEPHWIKAGEPAHRPGQVGIREHLLAAMTLDVDQNRRTSVAVIERNAGTRRTILPPLPIDDGQYQSGQQHLVDAAMECRRHPRQQRLGHRGRQRQRQMPGRAVHVPHRIELSSSRQP
jgi:hypothetical protein